MLPECITCFVTMATALSEAGVPTLWPWGLAQSATFWTANMLNMKQPWHKVQSTWIAYAVARGGNVEEHYLSPLAYSYSPGCDDPQGDAEDQKHCAWADSHQCLHHKPCVKVHLMRKCRQTNRLKRCGHLHYSAMFTKAEIRTTPSYSCSFSTLHAYCTCQTFEFN